MYFDFHAERTLSRLKEAAQTRGRLGRDLSYLLVPLVAGIIVCAVASRLVIAHPGHVLTLAGVATLGAGLALFVLGSVAFKLRVYGAYWRKRALALGFVAAATALATAVPALAAWSLVLGILTSVAVAEARELRRI
jgi:low temperature requirement protein LtrA